MKNNVQKENVPNPAANAGKYMLKCSGQVEEVLKSSFGLRFNSASMVMMANNFDFTEEKLDEVVVGEMKHRADEVEDGDNRVEQIGNLKVAIQSFKTRLNLEIFVTTLETPWKRFLTLKRLASALQTEHGTQPDFLLMIRSFSLRVLMF